MGAWTKGPWAVDGPPDNQIVWSAPEERVCFLAHSDGKDEERDVATGQLIAAAPDLAEALAGIVERIEAWETAVRSVIGGRDVEHGMDLTAARAALKKAKGEA